MFGITNDYIKSSHFKNHLESAKKDGKIVLTILLENLTDAEYLELNDFEIFDFTDSDFFKIKQGEVKRFQLFLNKARSNKEQFPQNFMQSWFKIQKSFSAIDQFEVVPQQERNFLVIFKEEIQNQIKIKMLNYEKGKVTTFLDIALFDSLICWIKFSERLICTPKFYKSDQLMAKLYEKNGDLVEELNLFEKFKCSAINSILCNNGDKEEIYVHCFQQSIGEIIHILDKCLNIIKTIENYSVYHLSFNYSNIIDFQNRRYSIFRNNRCSEVLIFQDLYKRPTPEILIFDLKSYSIIDSINAPHRYSLEMVLNNKMIFSNSSQNYLIYKINFNKDRSYISNSINQKYICKSNEYLKPPHLFSNPYLLPCGNSACLDCIHLNYNLYKKTFQCNFPNCKEEHKLTKKLEKDFNMINSINENCLKLSSGLMQIEKKILNDLGTVFLRFFKIFTNFFQLYRAH